MRWFPLRARWVAWRLRPRPGERRSFRRWTGADPRSILLIRLQAIGDTLVTLPVADALRRRFPKASISVVTGTRALPVVQSTNLFSEELAVDLSGGRRDRMLKMALLGWKNRGRWEVVVDLQRNRESRLLRRLLRPKAWSEFDRFGPASFLLRSQETVRAAGLEGLEYRLESRIRPELKAAAQARLRAEGWQGEPLLFFNPAGAWPSRHWPLARWVELARFWPSARILLLGEAQKRERPDAIAARLGPQALNLVGRTNLTEALAIVALVTATISEDGGLLHASWLGGVPTVAILGSSRMDWHSPRGAHTVSFGSDDLPCGNCMQQSCSRGDLLCLERVRAEQVWAALQPLLSGRRT